MRTRTLGPLQVSVVGLGCNNFGGRIDEAATLAVIDAALETGVTFFDTSDTYGNQGGSEELIGRALQGRRDRVVLATKWGKPMGDGAERRGSRDYILRAVEASLRRLQTDVIDLYQHHEEDPETPLEETVATVEQLVADGTVRAWGT
jgi:aryl-alcohol dehydrogenase-like predicted oxidoreductase